MSNIPTNVDQTRNLNIGFVGINGCTPPATNCYGSQLTEFSTAVTEMSTFIQAIYPIADQGSNMDCFQATRTSTEQSLRPRQLGSQISLEPIKTFSNLSIMGKLSTPQMDFVGGIVPTGYFSYHGMVNPAGPVIGYSGARIGQQSFLVEEDAWTAAAHEIGHSFGLLDVYSPAGCPVLVNGYWATRYPAVPILQLPELMCGSAPNVLLTQWMDATSYSTIFQTLEGPPIDPEVLLVTGLMMNDGTFQSSALYHWRMVPLAQISPETFL